MDIEETLSNDKAPMQNPPASHAKQFGKRLKNAREALKLSEKEVATRLHLSPKMIPIMENEAFAEGPPATFMRGYLRSYARLLQLTDEEINAALTDLETLIPTSVIANTPPIFKMQTETTNFRYVRWTTYLIVLVLIALVSVWWSSHPGYNITDLYPKTNVQTPATATPVAIPPQQTQAVTTAPDSTAPDNTAPNTTAPDQTTENATVNSANPTSQNLAPSPSLPAAPLPFGSTEPDALPLPSVPPLTDTLAPANVAPVPAVTAPAEQHDENAVDNTEDAFDNEDD